MKFRVIAKNFFSLSVGNVISQTMVFAAFVYLAGVLDAEQFGLFAFAQAAVNVVARATEFGLETVAVRRLTQHYGDEAIVENVVAVRLALTGLALVVIALWYAVTGFSDRQLVMFILSLSVIGISFSVEWKFLAAERMGVVSAVRIARSLFFFLPLLLIITEHRSVTLVSWIYTMSFLLVNGIAMIFLRRTEGGAWSAVSKERMVSLLKEGAPIAGANFLMQIQFYASTFVLGVVEGDAAVATFSAAFRPLIAVWTFGVMAVYNAIFPAMNAAVGEPELFSASVQRMSGVLTSAAIIFFLWLYPMSDVVMSMLYAGKFPGAAEIFALSLGVIALVIMRTAVEYSLIAQRKQREYLRGMIMVSGLYLVGCTLLGRQYGIMGVVTASLIAEVCYTVYIVLVSRSYLRQTTMGSMFITSAVVCIGVTALVSEYISGPPWSIGASIAASVSAIMLLRLFPFDRRGETVIGGAK